MKEIILMHKTFVRHHVFIQADMGVSLLAAGVDLITNEATMGLDHSAVRTSQELEE